MTNPTVPSADPQRTITLRQAWTNAIGITLAGCLLFGLGDFVFLAGYLPTVMDLYSASIWLELGFAVSGAILFVLIIAWQRRHRSSLADLGWGRPTTMTAMVCGVVLAVAWLGLCYLGIKQFLPKVDVTELTWTRMVLAPVSLFMAIAEETMMRGFFMTQLNRARVATWVQILASGICNSLYHALQNFTLEGLLPSVFFFSVLAGIYVLGKRSLTPSTVAHAIINIVGEPYLLMMLMVIPRN